MRFLSILLVPYLVSLVLNYINYKTKKNKRTRSLNKFIVRAPADLAYLGMIYTGMLVGMKLYGIIRHEEMGIRFDTLLFVMFIPGMMLLLGPLRGFWDVIVDGDDVTVVKAVIFRWHWKISKITYCKVGRGGMKVYVEGRKRKAFFVDGMCEHYTNFVKRMEKEGKEIRYPETRGNEEVS